MEVDSKETSVATSCTSKDAPSELENAKDSKESDSKVNQVCTTEEIAATSCVSPDAPSESENTKESVSKVDQITTEEIVATPCFSPDLPSESEKMKEPISKINTLATEEIVATPCGSPDKPSKCEEVKKHFSKGEKISIEGIISATVESMISGTYNMTSPMQQPYGSQARLSHPPQYQLPPPQPQGMVGMGSMGGGHPSGIVVPGSLESQSGIGMVDNSMNPAGSAGLGNPGAGQAQPIQPQRDFNTALLCRIGQETVQEIVAKTTELFQLLKGLQLPNGTSQSLSGQEERKSKSQDSLKSIGALFKRLRRIYEKCNENCSGIEYCRPTHIESLVPMKDEMDTKQEEKVTDAVKYLTEEHRDLVEQVVMKNRQLKEVIDFLRTIIWDINTMLAMRKM